jgi:hypothetical protein
MRWYELLWATSGSPASGFLPRRSIFSWIDAEGRYILPVFYYIFFHFHCRSIQYRHNTALQDGLDVLLEVATFQPGHEVDIFLQLPSTDLYSLYQQHVLVSEEHVIAVSLSRSVLLLEDADFSFRDGFIFWLCVVLYCPVYYQSAFLYILFHTISVLSLFLSMRSPRHNALCTSSTSRSSHHWWGPRWFRHRNCPLFAP